MSQWSGWKKLVLICVVCSAHLALLGAFNSHFSGTDPQGSKYDKRLSVTLVAAATLLQPTAVESTQPTASPDKSYVNRLDIQVQPAPAAQPTTSPYSPPILSLGGRTLFWDAEALDTTATPPDGFQQILEQRLPFYIESVVLEFLIDKEGNTVAVNCLEGDCNEKLQDDISKFTELKFTPAIKDSAAVASRKVIQIDPKSN